MSIMQVSRKVDYALRAAIYLAYQSDRRPCSVTEIAARTGGSETATRSAAARSSVARRVARIRTSTA